MHGQVIVARMSLRSVRRREGAGPRVFTDITLRIHDWPVYPGVIR